jgi:predicted PurR-regulated permease PerM
MVFVLAFYWLMERNTLKRSALRVVPRHRAKEVNEVWVELEEKLGAWVRGQLLLMLMIGVMALVTFIFVGLPSPIVLAVLAGLAEMIPILGPYIAFVPAVLITLTVAPEKVLLVVGCAVVIQLIETNVLVPRVMSHTVGISPLTIIIGIQAGAILYGLYGALLAVPIAAAAQVILAHALRAEDPIQAEAHGEADASAA